MSAAAPSPRDAVAAAVLRIERMGLEARYLAHGTYRVARAGREHHASYFTRDELIEFSALTGRVAIADALSAKRRPNHYFRQTEETTDMATEETTIDKTARKGKAPLPKPGEKKKAGRAAAAKKEAGAKKQPKAPKPKADKQPAGASVKGVTSEDLAYLNSFQEQTIERMNGQRVVEFFVQVKKASREKPVLHRDLDGIYPQRIARELARLGIVEKETIEGVGLAYYPKAAK